MRGTLQGVQPDGELIDEDGTRIPLVFIKSLRSENLSEASLLFRPERALSPNMTYTVTFSGTYHVFFTNEVNDSGQMEPLSWSFTTGESEFQGISNQALDNVVWGRFSALNGRFGGGNGGTCADNGSAANVLYFDELRNTEPLPNKVVYLFETFDANGALLGSNYSIFSTPSGSDARQRRIVTHVNSAWNAEGVCAQWTALDMYGHEVKSDLICNPDACLHTDRGGYLPLFDEESLLAAGPRRCSEQNPTLDDPDEPVEEPTSPPHDPYEETVGGGCSTLNPASPTPLAYGCTLLFVVGLGVQIRRKLR